MTKIELHSSTLPTSGNVAKQSQNVSCSLLGDSEHDFHNCYTHTSQPDAIVHNFYLYLHPDRGSPVAFLLGWEQRCCFNNSDPSLVTASLTLKHEHTHMNDGNNTGVLATCIKCRIFSCPFLFLVNSESARWTVCCQLPDCMSCSRFDENPYSHTVSHNQNLKPESKTGLVTTELSPNSFLLSFCLSHALVQLKPCNGREVSILHIIPHASHRQKRT